MKVEKQELVVLASGGGSTFQAIGQAIFDKRLDKTHIAGLISNKESAGVIDVARNLEISEEQIVIIDSKDPSYAENMSDKLWSLKPDLIAQLGWSALTPKAVIDSYPGKMINQHGAPIDPSPYDFGGSGMSCPERFHAARLMFIRETQRNYWTDVSSQRVHENLDEGVVLRRDRIMISKDDTVQTLKSKAIKKEWEVQIETIKDFEDGTVPELPAYDDLVRSNERRILGLSKQIARKLYTVNGRWQHYPGFDQLRVETDIEETELKRFVSHLLGKNNA